MSIFYIEVMYLELRGGTSINILSLGRIVEGESRSKRSEKEKGVGHLQLSLFDLTLVNVLGEIQSFVSMHLERLGDGNPFQIHALRLEL